MTTWPPPLRNPAWITRLLIGLTFTATHSSPITLSNALLDIAAASGSQLIWARILEETHVQITTNQGYWFKKSVARLISADTALRETFRLWVGSTGRGPVKEVIDNAGVLIPDGSHLPPGVKVGFWAQAIHHDEKIYPRALRYRPDR